MKSKQFFKIFIIVLLAGSLVGCVGIDKKQKNSTINKKEQIEKRVDLKKVQNTKQISEIVSNKNNIKKNKEPSQFDDPYLYNDNFRSVVIRPSFFYIGKLKTVKVFAAITPKFSIINDSVGLYELDKNNDPIRLLTPLYNDGTHGDIRAGDTEFVAELDFNEPSPRIIRTQVFGTYKENQERFKSEIEVITISEPAFYSSPDPKKIVEDENGDSFPVNHIIISLPQESSRDVAEAIASEIGGTIVGFSPSVNSFTLEVPTETIYELNALIGKLEIDPRIDTAVKNFKIQPFNVNFEL